MTVDYLNYWYRHVGVYMNHLKLEKMSISTQKSYEYVYDPDPSVPPEEAKLGLVQQKLGHLAFRASEWYLACNMVNAILKLQASFKVGPMVPKLLVGKDFSRVKKINFHITNNLGYFRNTVAYMIFFISWPQLNKNYQEALASKDGAKIQMATVKWLALYYGNAIVNGYIFRSTMLFWGEMHGDEDPVAKGRIDDWVPGFSWYLAYLSCLAAHNNWAKLTLKGLTGTKATKNLNMLTVKG